MTTHEIAEILGGGKVFVGRISSDLDLDQAIKEGFPAAAMEAVVANGTLSPAEVESLVLVEGTLEDRGHNEKLSPEESDRLVRIAEITALANETFGDPEKAARWLRKPCRALEGQVPIELLSTTPGFRLVEDSLHQIAHGTFA